MYTEDDFIRNFKDFYLKVSGLNPENEEIVRIIRENRQGNIPDFYLPKSRILIEIKGIHNYESNQRLAQWDRAVTMLKKQVDALPELNQINGLYSVTTPNVFKYPSKPTQFKEGAENLLRAIIDGREEAKVFDVIFQIKKINSDDKYIMFSARNEFNSVNPPGLIYKNISEKLKTANKQLSYTRKEVNKRILLLISQMAFSERIDDVIKAIGYDYKNLLSYENIDEIWIQVSTQSQPKYVLIYTKYFLREYESGVIKATKQNISLFQLWYYALSEMGDEHKEKIFSALKVFLRRQKPFRIFDDKFKRQEMVRLGQWLAEKNRFDDAIWIINKFIDDTDPGDPEDYKGNANFNYHQKILMGENLSTITTVLGHLAWVIQKLCLQKEYIVQGLNFTQRLIAHKNLYVKFQAMVPLIEISIRRQWLNGYGQRPYKGDYAKFHKLVFNLVKLVEKNPKLKVIARYLVHLFNSYKDLSTKEALEILNALKITSESASLFIYFAIYRGNHYKGQPIRFDRDRLIEELVSVIKSREPTSSKLQASLAWNFQDILRKQPVDFDLVKPYIDLLLESPYERELYHNIQYLIQIMVEKRPEICINWFETMLTNILEEFRDKSADVWIDSSEEVLSVIAKTQQDRLVSIMGLLVRLWHKGAFIGNIKMLFDVSKSIQDDAKRSMITDKFEEYYLSMKKENNRLMDVDFAI